ncbi:MAG: hypothetical protein N3B01_03165 [Verrucomicrobiae bacterium]|nr:hypothetical protein [Verrucomicrobiae bacterium]
MKTWFAWMVAVAVMVSAGPLFAQCGAAKKADADKPCCAALEKLELTEQQKAKVAALQEQCKTISCPVALEKKMAKELKQILSKEQYKQWQKACAEAKKANAGCCASR